MSITKKDITKLQEALSFADIVFDENNQMISRHLKEFEGVIDVMNDKIFRIKDDLNLIERYIEDHFYNIPAQLFPLFEWDLNCNKIFLNDFKEDLEVIKHRFSRCSNFFQEIIDKNKNTNDTKEDNTNE